MKIKLNHIISIIILLATIQYFMVSVSSPIVFGDEGYYASTAKWLSENNIIPKYLPLQQNIVYKTKFTIKPLFIMTETFFFYFGELAVKLMFPIFSVLSAYLIYLLLSSYKEKQAGLLAAISLLTIPSFITYGVMGYTDTALIMFTLLSIIFIKKSFETNKKIHILLAGIFMASALLTKISAMFLGVFIILYTIKDFDKQKLKKMILILLIFALVMSPWIIRNIILFSDTCYQFFALNPEACEAEFFAEIPKLEGLQFEGSMDKVGTNLDLISFGLLNYSLFAHGLLITILLLFGIGIMLKGNEKIKNLVTLLSISIFPIILLSTWRTEDTARYMLPLVIPISIIVGLALQRTYEYFKKYNKYIAIGIVIILVIVMVSQAQEKINTMSQVKQFSPGFIEGCDWIKENTPEDAILFATYMHQTKYQCYRRVDIARDKEEILLSNNDTSYEHLKLNGINYLIILEGLITTQKLSENYPVEFVNYVEGSNKFTLVYDNRPTRGTDGVRIYEIQ
jgi:4-amino-4-deoxy-L-arabinose transferase-like glycosyltransferase